MNNKRLIELKQLLKKKQLSHILISDLVDVEYTGGFRSSNASLLISSQENYLFSDFRYKESAEEYCRKNPEWKFILVKEQIYSSIGSYIPEGSVLGVQSNYLTLDNYKDLSSYITNVSFVQLSDEISDLFISKTEEEIASMQQAASIADNALERLWADVKEGISEIEIARKLDRICGDLGSEKPSFETIVLFGPRAALPHGRPGKSTLKTGDWILIDFGCTVNGFCSDMTRTVVMGSANSEQKRIYEIVLRAQKSALSAARAAMKSKDLDSIARTIIENEGFGEEFGHALGHGVGIRIHENPRISYRSEVILPENAVITIEPGIYVQGFGGIRIEDMIVLKNDGAITLSKSPKELIEL
ncbi:MAG: aminopeptidase P family protein [Fibrobacter sp.]|nr:aminopeptidase P family protein [Fibrobacter sp.]